MIKYFQKVKSQKFDKKKLMIVFSREAQDFQAFVSSFSAKILGHRYGCASLNRHDLVNSKNSVKNSVRIERNSFQLGVVLVLNSFLPVLRLKKKDKRVNINSDFPVRTKTYVSSARYAQPKTISSLQFLFAKRR